MGAVSQPSLAGILGGKNVGTPYWAHNIGATVGPIIAGVLAPVSYLLLFLGDALTTFCFGVLIWFHVPETRMPLTRLVN